ncbi:ester cyclase [Streptomyces noursei]|uniref:ester cyclase n=1 Tax=Streptomyces noursei TaxID=1971 RepID=UPI0023B87BBE|nr:ester cyclase [Streptomyces noursei]
MTSNKPSETVFTATAPGRRAMIGTLAGLGAAATLATAAPAHSAPGPRDSRRSPRQIAAAFYASYNADLAAGFERYISKDLVLHGFDGPNTRSAWMAGDLELKASLTGYRLDVFDQIAEGPKVVTRWSLGGTHTGTILGIPPSGREVHLSGISIDRIAGGQSVEHWSEGNFGRFLQILRGEDA